MRLPDMHGTRAGCRARCETLYHTKRGAQWANHKTALSIHLVSFNDSVLSFNKASLTAGGWAGPGADTLNLVPAVTCSQANGEADT